MPFLINQMRRFHVYILAGRKNGTLYTGVTNDIVYRTWEHQTGAAPGFSKQHAVKRLVYLEEHPTAEAAIQREKTIKGWPRRWKIDAIERDNPEWFDLSRRVNR